jgi:hypothetical protein
LGEEVEAGSEEKYSGNRGEVEPEGEDGDEREQIRAQGARNRAGKQGVRKAWAMTDAAQFGAIWMGTSGRSV